MAAQSAVLCLSVRHDVMQMMEKRVLSRFSFRKVRSLTVCKVLCHRSQGIYMLPNQSCMCMSMAFCGILKACFVLLADAPKARRMPAQALVLNLDPLGPAPAGEPGAGGSPDTDSCPAAVLHDMLALPQTLPQPRPAAGAAPQTLNRVSGDRPAAAAAAAARAVWAPPGGAFAVGWNAVLRIVLAQPALRARVNALHDRGAVAEEQ